MLQKIKRIINNLWWLLVVSSIASIIFGTVALLMPGMTIALIVGMFAVLLLVIGMVQFIQGFALISIDKSGWISLILGAFLSIFGIYLIIHPIVSLVTFIVFVGWVLIINGMMEIVFGVVKLGKKASWIFSGILGVIAGIIIWVYPASGTLAFVWVLGAYALINGIIMLSRAFAMRIAYKTIVDEMK